MVKQGSNSVLSLPAQTNKLLLVGNSDIGQVNALVSSLERNRLYLGNYYYLFMLMAFGGSRISETLNIGPGNITDLGQVYLMASKGSDNRLIGCEVAASFLLKRKRQGISPFAGMSRFTAYRLLKNCGIGRVKAGRLNSSVTHIFKDAYANQVRKVEPNPDLMKKLTGHKSAKNTEFYGKD